MTIEKKKLNTYANKYERFAQLYTEFCDPASKQAK